MKKIVVMIFTAMFALSALSATNLLTDAQIEKGIEQAKQRTIQQEIDRKKHGCSNCQNWNPAGSNCAGSTQTFCPTGLNLSGGDASGLSGFCSNACGSPDLFDRSTQIGGCSGTDPMSFGEPPPGVKPINALSPACSACFEDCEKRVKALSVNIDGEGNECPTTANC